MCSQRRFLRGFLSIAAAVVMLMVPAAWSAEYYVATAGSDDDRGTKQSPFRTMQKAADVMEAGDTCYVRGGIYREAVNVEDGGSEGKPLRFVAYPGEIVTLSGTEPLQADWEVHDGAIYRAGVDSEFIQLFVDGDMMVEARWPNRSFERLWDRSTWGQAINGSAYGKLKDPELAKTGIDFTGALAVMNLVHQFWTWTRPVTDHEPNRNYFNYPKDLGEATEMRYADKTWPWRDDRYYLRGKLEALDQPGEWLLDRDTGTLYLWTRDGGQPSTKTIEYKARKYAFDATDADYVQLQGFHFFGATFRFMNCNHCVVDGCHLLFPTYERELPERKAERGQATRTIMRGHYNTVRNCSIGYTPVSGLHMSGRQIQVVNNLVHDICWNGSLHYVGIRASCWGQYEIDVEKGATVAHNSVYNCGNAIISYGNQPTNVEYNHVYDGGLACKDVALVYTGGPRCAGSQVRYNWVHGCRTEEGSGLGIRGDDQTRELTVHHNVVWDCGRDGIIIKGDRNKVHNNTCLYIGTKWRLGNYIAMPVRAEPKKPWRKQHPLLDKQNVRSEIYNNAARTIVGNQSKRTPFPWEENLSHNYRGEELGLRAPPEWDFRPTADSPLVDAGREIAGFTEGFEGRAPDIGGYEYGGRHWIPGHRNGLWVGPASAASPEGQRQVPIALLMPVRRSVEIAVRVDGGAAQIASDDRIVFTPDDWMHPRHVTIVGAASGGIGLRFQAPSWGNVRIQPASIDGPEGTRAWFELPATGEPQPPGERFETERPEPAGTGLAEVRPVARAFRVESAPAIDGRIADNEWPGWVPHRSLLLRPLSAREQRTDVAGEALVLFDDDSLYVAFHISGAETANLLRTEGEWGETDGVEVDFQTVVAGKVSPVFVLHGFPSGGFESVTDAGAAEAEAQAVGNASEFAARIGDEAWTAEFRIPMGAAGIDIEDLEAIHFNLGALVGRGEDAEWHAWARTHGPNYAVRKAGTVALLPVCRATEQNLLQNGDFESENLDPWRTSTNRDSKLGEELPIERVQEAADGGWCMRFTGEKAAVMRESIAKWIHPLDTALGAGTYVLSYDMRVSDLTPRGSLGTFNGYIRTWTEPGKGRNAGQTEYAFEGSNLPWTRRDCVIEVRQDEQPTFVSLQLHRATGTVWVDNVCLIKVR